MLAPPPLNADASYYNSLSATDRGDFLGQVFKTAVPTPQGRWKYIYVHHTATPSGNALTLGQLPGGLGDHFVIGNGVGCQDGEIQVSQRWNKQLPATPPAGVQSLDPACISVALVGDFDATAPTPTQVRRLAQLIATLQGQLRIGSDGVVLLEQPGNPAGVGKYFPQTSLREQILP